MGIKISESGLNIHDVAAVARKKASVELSGSVKTKISQSREIIENYVKNNKTVYGVTTGFGPLCKYVISPKKAEELQENLIKSHSSGVGDYLPQDIVRACMLIRCNTLAKGCSGVRLEIIENLIEMLNKGVHPLIPETGSVGASGDLNPLSHMALPLIGEGFVEYKGKIIKSEEAFKECGIEKINLSYKEGLSLINGTSVMTGIAALLVYDSENILKIAELGAAFGLEVLDGIIDAYDERLQNVKSHPGQIKTAQNIREMLKGSRNVKDRNFILNVLENEKTEDDVSEVNTEIQNAYSLRCAPQILGPVSDIINYVKRVVETEMNSVTDNPIVFSEGKEILHGCNFHGQPVSMAMDFLSVGLAEIGVLSERRTARVLDKNLNNGLPAFLIKEDTGLKSGFMGMQYIASSCVAENAVLSSPVSIQSVSTNANNQDVVSMGTVAARKCKKVLENIERILGVELLVMCQAVDVKNIADRLGVGTKKAYDFIREQIPVLEEDRILSDDLNKIIGLIKNRSVLKAIQ